MEEDKVFASLEDAINTYKEKESNALKEYSLACALNQYGEHLFERAEAFKQLAEWLTELKSLKEDNMVNLQGTRMHELTAEQILDRELAKADLNAELCYDTGYERGFEEGQKQTIKTAHWELFDECSNAGVYCSNCHKKVYKEEYANQKLKSKYCPNCGARMNENEGIDKLINTLPVKVVEELELQRNLIRKNSSKNYQKAVDEQLFKVATYLTAIRDTGMINEEQLRKLYKYYTEGAGEKE